MSSVMRSSLYCCQFQSQRATSVCRFLCRLKTDYVGIWYNELGSCMEITSAQDGQLSGTYASAVGDATKQYVLTGRYDSSVAGKSISWTVNWKNSYRNAMSTTGWSGQFQTSECGKPQILTTWLLTAQTDPKDDWNSTHVGMDTFTRQEPASEVCEKALKSGRISHPKGAHQDH